MLAAEEASVGGEGRGVYGLENEVLLGVDDRPFLLGVGAPKHKDEAVAFVGQLLDDAVGELFPSLVLVRCGLVGPYGQDGV